MSTRKAGLQNFKYLIMAVYYGVSFARPFCYSFPGGGDLGAEVFCPVGDDDLMEALHIRVSLQSHSRKHNSRFGVETSKVR